MQEDKAIKDIKKALFKNKKTNIQNNVQKRTIRKHIQNNNNVNDVKKHYNKSAIGKKMFNTDNVRENLLKKSNNYYEQGRGTVKNNTTIKDAHNINNVHSKKHSSNDEVVKVIPLGGIGEIGKNMTVYEYKNEIIVVDCGLIFPDNDMFGVDLVIPDYTYLIDNKHKVKGVFITHGHEDHIGALPYFLKDINVPVYGTKLTIGLIEGKLTEHRILKECKLNEIRAGMTTKVGSFSVEYIRVNHSIPGAVSLCIRTPVGNIIQTGDFKVDFTPIKENTIDLINFARKGHSGVQLLLSDSTNAEKEGSSMSESTVGRGLENIFSKFVDKRIIVATFASNVYRAQQIVDLAVKHKRKIAVSGRSMENVTEIARKLGYLTSPAGIFIDINEARKLSPHKVVIITTGSQGEPMAALSRMACKIHRQIFLTEDDCIVISAKPVPGNEKAVTKVINELLKTGCEVVYDAMYDIHVSGHAYADELRLMLNLTKPKFFLPVHGEYKQLKKHAEIAKSMGVKDKNIIMGNIGNVFELRKNSFTHTDDVVSGKILVDGLGVGDVGSVVLKDRKHLSQDGLIVVVMNVDGRTGRISKSTDIVSRGFVYVKESEDLMESIKDILAKTLSKCEEDNIREWGAIKIRVRETLSNMIYRKTKRSPMILPIITEL